MPISGINDFQPEMRWSNELNSQIWKPAIAYHIMTYDAGLH